MITMHYETPIYNGLPLTRNCQIDVLKSILTQEQLSSLNNGYGVRLNAKQQVLMSINIYRI